MMVFIKYDCHLQTCYSIYINVMKIVFIFQLKNNLLGYINDSERKSNKRINL